MGSIKAVVSEPIENREEYHMLASISCCYIVDSAVHYPIYEFPDLIVHSQK